MSTTTDDTTSETPPSTPPDRAALAERVLVAVDEFIKACPLITVRRCFWGFPSAIESAYGELWTANMDYIMSAPIPEETKS